MFEILKPQMSFYLLIFAVGPYFDFLLTNNQTSSLDIKPLNPEQREE